MTTTLFLPEAGIIITITEPQRPDGPPVSDLVAKLQHNGYKLVVSELQQDVIESHATLLLQQLGYYA